MRDAGTYFGFKVLDKAVPFLLLPIVARTLGPEQYGIFVLFQALAGLALPLMTLSVDGSILLNYFKVSARAFPSYFASGYRLILMSSVGIGFLIFAVRVPLMNISGFPAAWILAVPLYCFFQLHTNLALNLFQVRRQASRYGWFSVALTLCKNGFMLVLVLRFQMMWQGVVIGYTAAQALFSLIAVAMFLRSGLVSARPRRAFVLDNVRVGYPLAVHQVGAWGSGSATRVIVASILGAGAAGSFGVGAAIAMAVMFVQDAFNKAYVPYLFGELRDFTGSVEAKLVRLTYGYVAVLLGLATATGLAGSLLIVPVFGPEFADGRAVVLPLCLAYAFEGAYKMHVNYIFYAKRTHLILLITLTTGVVNIVLSFLLVQRYGLLGSALSLWLINVLGYALAWRVGNAVFPMRWFRRGG